MPRVTKAATTETDNLPAAAAGSQPREENVLALIEAFGRSLSKRQMKTLRVMRDDEEELIFEGDRGYVGNHPIGSGTFHALLRACAIRSTGGAYYEINETGLKILATMEGEQQCS